MALGNNVQVFRQARGESLSELARAVGMDKAHLQRVERGVAGCSDEFKVKIAQHFRTDVGRIFFQPTVDKMDTAEAPR